MSYDAILGIDNLDSFEYPANSRLDRFLEEENWICFLIKNKSNFLPLKPLLSQYTF